MTKLRTGIALVVVTALVFAWRPAAAQEAVPDLTGLWAAKVRFGPDIRGPVALLRAGTGWRADIAGYSVAAGVDDQRISFELPDGKGRFRGKLGGRSIVGHWIGRPTYNSGLAYATPVVLQADGPNRWRGEVIPLEDSFTFYMPVTRRADGTYAAYLRNPERNQGRFIPVSRVERKGNVVKLLGGSDGEADAAVVEGRYDEGVMRLPLRGASFDFTKADSDFSSPFYPRGKRSERYRYSQPLRLDDGWPVATLEEAGISRKGIEAFVQMLVDMPMDSLSTSQIHSLLIARHGKLVLEEYFHGYHRDRPHDTRSAAKSWVAVLLGAAMQAGVPIRLDTPVYRTMLASVPGDLDPRKRAMTLEHLISMTAGYDCSGESAPGDEDVMMSQTEEPNWYRYTLNVPMVTAPGDTIVYCSIEPNLAAGILQKISGEPLPELFYRLVAEPLRMRNYHLLLSPTGDAYGGGGHHFLPRDFLKLAQLMVNDGRWNGRQIMSREWARSSGAALRNLSPSQQYGWLWNSVEYPYKGRNVRAFFAAGNGGQIFMGIPDLDLAIGFTGGNYADAAMFIPGGVFVPRYLLPAVD
ncbi:MAG TPA: serine hydrolase domain-containing protein [Gemmatimonadales bacterium]|nr:serine hydrolase domain-containing protein [Gemmatimonadales bacterium]